MLYIVFLLKFLRVATQSEATEQYFAVVLFIFRYKVVPSFRSLSELLMCDHSVEDLPGVYFAIQRGLQLLNLWTKFLFDLSNTTTT